VGGGVDARLAAVEQLLPLLGVGDLRARERRLRRLGRRLAAERRLDERVLRAELLLRHLERRREADLVEVEVNRRGAEERELQRVERRVVVLGEPLAVGLAELCREAHEVERLGRRARTRQARPEQAGRETPALLVGG